VSTTAAASFAQTLIQAQSLSLPLEIGGHLTKARRIFCRTLG
jgi:hypothetical protein